jgi:dCTP deaminase
MVNQAMDAVQGSGRADLGLDEAARGVLPNQYLTRAIEKGFIDAGEYKIQTSSIQPASLDLRLGEVAYRIRSSFLPDTRPVDVKLKDLVIDELDLRREGAVLETNRPYLIPLLEQLNLPSDIRGKANPKSSTGRLDVFTRVITDHSYRFDEIAPGYSGRMWLEVVPLSFTVRVRQHLALNQLRLSVGSTFLTDAEIEQVHAREPLVYVDGVPVPADGLATGNGLFLGLDLSGDVAGNVGYRARDNAPVIDMSLLGEYEVTDFWEPVRPEGGGRVVLAPEHFYLLLSEESVSIPPGYAAEMTAYDPTSGELRTHYAGFFDPGFGFDPSSQFFGTKAALEVRAHDVPFMIEHRQRVCKLNFERMLDVPSTLYGTGIGSSYQRQADTLSKHFKVHGG